MGYGPISGVATKAEDVRTIVGSHQTSEGNAVDLALSHGAAWGEETICTMRLKVVVPHRKERGHSNGRYHDWRSWNHPTRRSERRRTLSSEELGDEIRLLPGRPRTPKSSPSSIRSLRFRLDWWLWCCRG